MVGICENVLSVYISTVLLFFRPEIQKLASVLFYTAMELLRQLLLLLCILEGFFLIEFFFYVCSKYLAPDNLVP